MRKEWPPSPSFFFRDMAELCLPWALLFLRLSIDDDPKMEAVSGKSRKYRISETQRKSLNNHFRRYIIQENTGELVFAG